MQVTNSHANGSDYSMSPLVYISFWRPRSQRGGTPHNHYEMTRPFGPSTPEPILYVSLKPCPPRVTGAFAEVEAFPAKRVPLVQNEVRLVYTRRLTGLEGTASGGPE